MGQKLLHNTGKELQSLGQCSASRAFEQEEIFIVPHPAVTQSPIVAATSQRPPY
jgi:hypothetical protein